MERLINGYRTFRETYWKQNKHVFEALADGQAPHACIIACCDSRVDPSMIFNAEPGEIFVVRNVANLVPPYSPNADHHGTSAAIEFAVRGLGVTHIIVMGHSKCGGVHRLLEGASGTQTDFIDHWMEIASEARETALAANVETEAERHCVAERENIRVSVRNLTTFPWIIERQATGTLELHGWYFDIEHGELSAVAGPLIEEPKT